VVFEKGIDPLVQNVPAMVNGRLFKGVAFAVGERLQPYLALLFESNVGVCFDEGLRGVDAELF
jgi:hypothetical protein